MSNETSKQYCVQCEYGLISRHQTPARACVVLQYALAHGIDATVHFLGHDVTQRVLRLETHGALVPRLPARKVRNVAQLMRAREAQRAWLLYDPSKLRGLIEWKRLG